MLRGLENLCIEGRLGRECVPDGLGRDGCAQTERQMRPNDENIQILLTRNVKMRDGKK